MGLDRNLSRAEIEAQLQKILRSEEFSRSTRITKFLEYVVRQTVLYQPKVIRAYAIAVDVFGKGPEFDPQDPYIRNISGLTRKALAKYYNRLGQADSILITVPSGNFIAVFEKRSFPPVIEKSYAASGELLVKEPSVDYTPVPANPVKLPLLAIIPLVRVGNDRPREISYGEIVANEVIASLTHSTSLELVSRLTTTKFAHPETDYERIHSEIGADYALTGTYYSKGEQLRLTLELAELRSAHVVWAESISCEANDLTAQDASVISEIARQCSINVLHHEVSRASTQPIGSASLHTSLLAGISFMHCVPDSHFEFAKDYFDCVLKAHPENARVNALLAQWHTYKLNRGGGWRHGAKEETKRKAKEYCEKALRSDPSNSLALVTSGLVYTQFDGDPDRGFEYYKSAEFFNPNEPLVYACQSVVQAYWGNVDAARLAALRAIKLSPFDPQLHFFETCAAAAEFAANNLEQAERHALEADQLNPNHSSNIRALIAIQIDLGKTDLARRNAKRLLKKDPSFTTSSYLSRYPTGSFEIGNRVAKSLALAGVPVD